jgi:nucleoside-diphosphate-sugar epimerase
MRVFVTGATGFIGSAVVQELLGAGHKVIALARSDAAAKSLVAAGAQAHRGSLDDLESLRRGAAAADGVIHLAFMHGLSSASLRGRLRIFLGGAPGGIVSRFMALTTGADRAAIDTFGAALKDSGRPLVVTFGTMGLVPSGRMTEDDAPDPRSPGAARAVSEDVARGWATRGVRASIVRLPPSVHGDGDTGLVRQLIGIARKKSVSTFVGDGRNRWSAVHRLDAAVLFRLALEQGVAGARYHGVADEGVPFRAIADVIGKRLGVPVVGKSLAEAAPLLSWLAPFVAADNPASSQRTREQLGWLPKQPGLMVDLDRQSYFGS